MAIDKNIQELLDAEVIDQGTADRITDYYSAKKTNSPNLLLTIFAVLGSFLVGLGIILIGRTIAAHRSYDLVRRDGYRW